jgi:peptide/nickel transport system permease protein
MAVYLVQRIWQSALVLLAVSVLSFVLIFLSGDPVASLIPLNARQEDIENIRRQYNLDQPVAVQYLIFLQKAATGDMGESFKFKSDALSIVLGRLPSTILLACTSMLLSIAVSLPLGILAATYKGRLPDVIASGVALLGISMPSFWLGVILILVFAGGMRWLPASGSGTWQHLILPTVTVSAFATGLMIRLVRRSVADTLGQMYGRQRAAKGYLSGPSPGGTCFATVRSLSSR